MLPKYNPKPIIDTEAEKTMAKGLTGKPAVVPKYNYTPPDWLEEDKRPGDDLIEGAKVAKTAPPLTLYQQELARKLTLAREKGAASTMGAPSPQYTFQEWIKTPQETRSGVGNMFPTPTETKYGSPMTPTWYGAADKMVDGKSHYWYYSAPLILDQLARDLATKRLTPKEVYEAYKKTSSIPYTVLGNPVDVPFSTEDKRPVIGRGNKRSITERIKKAMEAAYRKKNPPVQFTPPAGTKWKDLG